MLHRVSPIFCGTREAARLFLSQHAMDRYYTYILLAPDNVPFYVGKGTKHRALQHENEALVASNLAKSNPFKCNTIRKIIANGKELIYHIDALFDPCDELACLQREEWLISLYRRRSDGGSLTNLAAGLGSLSGNDPFSRARHAATLSGLPEERPERAAVNIFLSGLGTVDSVPIKPLSEYRTRLVAAYPSPKNLKTLSIRNGLTLVASAIASGIALKEGAVLPRVFDIYPDPETWPLSTSAPQSVKAVIENGAASDVLKLGLATLRSASLPLDESFSLDQRQIERLRGVLGTAFWQRHNL